MSNIKNDSVVNLFDLIAENKELVIVDAKKQSKHKLEDILLPIAKNIKGRKLSFLYLNSDFTSLSIYLSFLKTDHILVLLSDSIETHLKVNLEKEYEPSIIFDAHRDVIPNYEATEINNDIVSVRLLINSSFNTKVNDNIKVLLSTSGTTGSPKFVKLSHNNILQNALSISDYLPINSDDVVPINLPLHYSYGLSVLHSNAISGGEIVCGLPDILDRNFWKYLDNYGFTSIAGVPFVYEMLNRIGFLKKIYPSLKYISQAGGNLSEKIKIKFRDYCIENHLDFFVMYGQTEATARISYVPPQNLKDKITSIGVPIKNGKIIIDDVTGELCYSGPNVFGGYANERKDLTIWEDISILKTGDLAFKDEDGFHYIKGRLKRIVKVFGNRINLDEVEAFLKSNLENSLLACTGINDQFILVSYNNSIDEAQVKSKLFEAYKIHNRSIKFISFDELPKTNNGKINYKKINSIYLGR